MTSAPERPSDVDLPDLHEVRAILITAIADDELVTGHRSSHWTGVAPSIEEDLAFSTLAQDEINHADVWYQLLVGTDRASVDRLGLGRAPEEYRHAVICERRPRDFAYTLARQWLYDHWDTVRLRVLTGSSDEDIGAVATKLLHEERYHLEHADHWFRRLAQGGQEPHEQLRHGLSRAFPEALWLAEPLPHEDQMLAGGLLPAYSAALLIAWLEDIVPMLEGAELTDVLPDDLEPSDGGWVLPDDYFAEPGGRRGVHSDEFTDDVWPEMTALYREHPGARW